jgi:hypothetical protein
MADGEKIAVPSCFGDKADRSFAKLLRSKLDPIHTDVLSSEVAIAQYVKNLKLLVETVENHLKLLKDLKNNVRTIVLTIRKPRSLQKRQIISNLNFKSFMNRAKRQASSTMMLSH